MNKRTTENLLNESCEYLDICFCFVCCSSIVESQMFKCLIKP